jgi:protein-L-isoaspartate(D-aspartate) O-methyltransferase
MDTIERAFQQVDRLDFIPRDMSYLAAIDGPLPIGFGQTISQPSTVRLMLEWLDVQPGDKVLDIGSGSGWSSALLAHIVGLKGKVLAVERIPALVLLGRKNCQKAGVSNVEFYHAGNDYGLSEHAPYDRILVSAAADHLPETLINQLKINGKLVIPFKHDILEIVRTGTNGYTSQSHHGFVFVPLIK